MNIDQILNSSDDGEHKQQLDSQTADAHSPGTSSVDKAGINPSSRQPSQHPPLPTRVLPSRSNRIISTKNSDDEQIDVSDDHEEENSERETKKESNMGRVDPHSPEPFPGADEDPKDSSVHELPNQIGQLRTGELSAGSQEATAGTYPGTSSVRRPSIEAVSNTLSGLTSNSDNTSTIAASASSLYTSTSNAPDSAPESPSSASHVPQPTSTSNTSTPNKRKPGPSEDNERKSKLKRSKAKNSQWTVTEDQKLVDLVLSTLPTQDFSEYARILNKRDANTVRYRWKVLVRRAKGESNA